MRKHTTKDDDEIETPRRKRNAEREMVAPVFSRRAAVADSIPRSAALGRAPDRRSRGRKGLPHPSRWSSIFFGGLALVVLAVFALGAWQLSALTSGTDRPWHVGGGGGRRWGRSAGSALRFVPSDRLRRRLEESGGLDALRSERRLAGVRPPKLALVMGSINKDSKSLMLLTITKSLLDLGYRLMIFTEKEADRIIWESVGCPVIILSSASSDNIDWSKFEGVIISSLEGEKVVQRLSLDPFKSLPVIWLIQEDILGKRLPHYAEWGWQELIDNWRSALSRADVVVFPDFSLPILYTSLDTGNFFVIPGTPVGIVTARIYAESHSQNQLRENYGFAEEDLLIVVVGSSLFYDELSWHYDTVMHTLGPEIMKAARIADLLRVIKLIILCGNSTVNYGTDAQKVAARMGFPESSVRHYCMDHDVNGFLLIADIVIYGSFQEEQSFPPMLFQAMSFEIPVIVPNLTVVRKHIVDGVNGFIFNPGDVNSLARAFSILIKDEKLSALGHSVALQGRLLSMNTVASDCIVSYAKLLENVLQFPSDTFLPKAISQMQQKGWLWDLFDNGLIKHDSENFEVLNDFDGSHQKASIVFSLEKQFAEDHIEKWSQIENNTSAEDFPTKSDWDDTNEMEASEEFMRQEMQELDERTEKSAGSWEEVYQNSRKAEKQKSEINERDEGQLERTGEPLCIYEIYSGEGASPFLHHGSIYRGITLSKPIERSRSDDVDAVSRLPVLENTYFRDLLCELGAMFAIANRVDNIHKLPWIGFQSWRTASRNVSLTANGEKVLESTIQDENQGDVIYFWAVLDPGHKNMGTMANNDFWSMCDLMNAAQCRSVFEEAFRTMYGLPDEMAALPPMPSDGDRWSILHSWVMPTSSFLEFMMFSRIFADSLDRVNQNNKNNPGSCLLGSSMFEKRNCYCRVLEVLVNVWAYHSARRIVYLNPISGELKEQHLLEQRNMWVKYFDFTLLKSMDEDMAEESDDGMHTSDRWLWPLTGEVHWQGVLDREREDRYRRKMDKKRRTKEKLLDRQKHGYKQKSLDQKAKSR